MGRSSISKREFSRTRDYLLTTCLLQNASQPGPLENALVQPFKQVVFCSATNTWTLLVDHQGPAEIVLDKTLHRWMTIYAKYIRPQFPAEEDEHLFIKDDGLPFGTGIIGKRVTKVFKSAGVCPDMRITATLICKMYSSASPPSHEALWGHSRQKLCPPCQCWEECQGTLPAEGHSYRAGHGHRRLILAGQVRTNLSLQVQRNHDPEPAQQHFIQRGGRRWDVCDDLVARQ